MLTIRRATYEEARAIKEFDQFIGDRRIDNSRGELFVALSEDKVVGYVQYSSNQFYNRPFISLVCVRGDHQRNGIASALLRKVVEMFQGIDVWTSTESWNEPAKGMFKKVGFIKAGEIMGLNRDDSTEEYFVKHGDL